MADKKKPTEGKSGFMWFLGLMGFGWSRAEDTGDVQRRGDRARRLG